MVADAARKRCGYRAVRLRDDTEKPEGYQENFPDAGKRPPPARQEAEPGKGNGVSAYGFKSLRFADFPIHCLTMQNHATARFFFCAVIS